MGDEVTNEEAEPEWSMVEFRIALPTELAQELVDWVSNSLDGFCCGCGGGGPCRIGSYSSHVLPCDDEVDHPGS